MSAVWVTAPCPACGGGSSLFVADGGFITCARVACPNPEVAHAALETAARAEMVRRNPMQTTRRTRRT